MRRPRGASFLLLSSVSVAIIAGGCASSGDSRSVRATLSFEKIPFAPASSAPAAEAADLLAPPPLEAIALFARGHAQMSDGDVVGAIDSLERAATLDPDSYELRRALGKALRESPADQSRALLQFERAAALQPNRIDAQLDLGREYLTHRDAKGALQAFARAIHTPQYAAGDTRSDEADFLLATALRDNGYLRAAVDRLQSLASRIVRSRDAGGSRLMRVQVQLGDLYLQQHRPADTLSAYRAAEATRTGAGELPIAERICNVLLVLHRPQEAERTAAQAVLRQGVTPESIELLRKTCRFTGQSSDAIAVMANLCRAEARDPLRLFALCQVAEACKEPAAAEKVLADLWRKSPGNAAILVRRFELAWSAGDDLRSLRLLIDAVATQPELFDQLGPIWVRLLCAEGCKRVSPELVQQLAVDSTHQSARDWIAWRMTRGWPPAETADVSATAATAIESDETLSALQSRVQAGTASDASYAALHEHYVRLRQFEEAEAVLAAWQRNWPPDVPNPQLLLLRARRLMLEERYEAAELTLAELQQHDPAFPGVQDALRTVHERSRRAAVGAAIPR